ncbi:hypothetical protein Ciccas_005999 [Cichlidogyrus casuarinus]|uniref:Uncharacterized protein n=1 Tax=Cichlidogyrus casuarinus TaxID=1844966 RepID=A0ABD2Q814_9PLAT
MQLGLSRFFQQTVKTAEKSFASSTPMRKSQSQLKSPPISEYELPISIGEPDLRVGDLVWCCLLAYRTPQKQKTEQRGRLERHRKSLAHELQLAKSDMEPSQDRSDLVVEPSLDLTRQPPKSQIVVVSASQPSTLMESFIVTSSTVSCMAPIPGSSMEIVHYGPILDDSWNAIPFHSASRETGVHSMSNISQMTHSNSFESRAKVESTCSEPSPKHPVLLSDRLSAAESTSSLQQKVFQEVKTAYSVRRRHLINDLQRRSGSLSSNDNIHSSDDTNDANQTRVKESPQLEIGDNLPCTVQATMWLGCQNGEVFIHSTVTQFRKCLASVRLPDSVTCITYMLGCVYVGLANGQIYVFRRSFATSRCASRNSVSAAQESQSNQNSSLPIESANDQLTSSVVSADELVGNSNGEDVLAKSALTGRWDLTESVVLDCGSSQQGIKTMCAVPPANSLWIAYKNRIVVIDQSASFKITNACVPSFSRVTFFQQI